MHSRKSIIFHNRSPRVKKDNDDLFDVTMGSFDGAEVCKLIGLSILNDLANKYWTNNIGLYRDEGLAIFKNTTGPQVERTQKEITRHFKEHGPKITIQSNLKSLDYLAITLNLTNGLFQPYRRPNDEPLYIITNHPLSSSKYPQPSIANYQPYHPTKKHSTELSLSTTKPLDQVDSTKALTTARKTLPHPRKEIVKETSFALTPNTAKMSKPTSLKPSST